MITNQQLVTHRLALSPHSKKVIRLIADSGPFCLEFAVSKLVQEANGRMNMTVVVGVALDLSVSWRWASLTQWCHLQRPHPAGDCLTGNREEDEEQWPQLLKRKMRKKKAADTVKVQPAAFQNFKPLVWIPDGMNHSFTHLHNLLIPELRVAGVSCSFPSELPAVVGVGRVTPWMGGRFFAAPRRDNNHSPSHSQCAVSN